MLKKSLQSFNVSFSQTTVFEKALMPRRELLTSTQRSIELLAFPTDEAELLQYYTFNTHDLAMIKR